MVDFRALLGDKSINAPLAWLSTAVLVLSVVYLFASGNLLWGVFGLLIVSVVVVPPVLTRSLATTMPGELVAVVTLPVVFRVAGLFPETTPYVAIAGVAILVVLVLDGFTSLEMAPRFAVLFVTITTMAFAGGWAMVEFTADFLLGTEAIEGQRALNLDLVSASIIGVLAGGVFEVYFRQTEGADPLQGRPMSNKYGGGAGQESGQNSPERSEPQRSMDGGLAAGETTPTDGATAPGATEETGKTVDDEPDVLDGMDNPPSYRLIIRALQAVLVLIVGFSLITLDGQLFINSAVPLLLTFLPFAARSRYDYPVHGSLALLISFAATLHAIGALGPYSATDWYDTFTHALSSTLVAGVGYVIAHGLELHTDRVSFSPRFQKAFIVLFVLAVGVFWEILEFSSGLVFGLFGEPVLAQYGVSDIVKDLVFNTVGAFVVAIWGTSLFRRVSGALAGSVGKLFQ